MEELQQKKGGHASSEFYLWACKFGRERVRV